MGTRSAHAVATTMVAAAAANFFAIRAPVVRMPQTHSTLETVCRQLYERRVLACSENYRQATDVTERELRNVLVVGEPLDDRL